MWGSSRADVARTYQLLEGYLDAPGAKESPQSNPFTLTHPCLSRVIEESGMTPSEARKQFVHCAILCLLIIGVAAVLRRPILLGSVGVVLVFQWLVFRNLITRRREAFERDYTAMLLSLASSIRTGLDPLVALIRLKELFSVNSEVRKELIKLSENVDAGVQEEDALQLFGSTINHPDIPLFRAAFILSRKEGSSLSECLQRLARVTRQRQSFRRKVRSAVAMQKLSAIGIGMCTVAIGGIQMVSNPAAIQAAWNHPVGSKLLCLGVSLVVCGIGWMFKMASPKT